MKYEKINGDGFGKTILAGEPGLEPELHDPESYVLPLNYSPVRVYFMAVCGSEQAKNYFSNLQCINRDP